MGIAIHCHKIIDHCLSAHHYSLHTTDYIGRLYTKPNAPAVWIDVGLFDLEQQNYSYTDYTSKQNSLMYAYAGLLRFLWQDESDLTRATA